MVTMRSTAYDGGGVNISDISGSIWPAFRIDTKVHVAEAEHNSVTQIGAAVHIARRGCVALEGVASVMNSSSSADIRLGAVKQKQKQKRLRGAFEYTTVVRKERGV